MELKKKDGPVLKFLDILLDRYFDENITEYIVNDGLDFKNLNVRLQQLIDEGIEGIEEDEHLIVKTLRKKDLKIPGIKRMDKEFSKLRLNWGPKILNTTTIKHVVQSGEGEEE